jgi:hypothetical protein
MCVSIELVEIEEPLRCAATFKMWWGDAEIPTRMEEPQKAIKLGRILRYYARVCWENDSKWAVVMAILGTSRMDIVWYVFMSAFACW